MVASPGAEAGEGIVSTTSIGSGLAPPEEQEAPPGGDGTFSTIIAAVNSDESDHTAFRKWPLAPLALSRSPSCAASIGAKRETSVPVVFANAHQQRPLPRGALFGR